MKLVFLGTSASQPTENRGLSCVCLERDGEILMFDAGEATQMAYMRSGLGWNKKMKLFVTHLHGDHCVGILGLLQTMSMQKRTKTLEIFGPEGIKEFIDNSTRILGFRLSFEVSITIVKEGVVIEDEKFSIDACIAEHSVTAFSYLFKEKDKPGRFNAERAKELEVPKGQLWGKLQSGQDVVLGTRTVRPEQVLGPSRVGKKIGISGDTVPTKKLERFFEGCDYLVFEATFLDSEEQKAKDTHHSTASQAAILGKNADVKNLILTHFSARYRDEAEHLKEAKKIFDCVIAAKDLLQVEIK